MKTEKQWEAEGDAHTLATAKQIEADPKRIAAAKKAAPALANEQQGRADALASVTKGIKLDRAKPAKRRTSRIGKLTGL